MNFNPPYEGNYKILDQTPYTNAAYRAAFLAAIIRGANDVASLLPFSNHVQMRSDDGESLRGALGPRMRYWVGVDQYKEMIDANLDVFQEDEYVKPQGVDQLACVNRDIEHGLPTAITFRDPSLDFDTSDDIPDIISMSFVPKNNGRFLDVSLNYVVCDGEEFVNEMWALSVLAQMVAANVPSIERVNVTVLGDEGEPLPESVCTATGVGMIKESDLMRTAPDLDDAYRTSADGDLELFMDACMHARMLFSKSALDNVDVSVQDNVKMFTRKYLEGGIKCLWLNDALRTMAIHLILSGATKNTGEYEESVIDLTSDYYMRWMYDESKATAKYLFNFKF